MGRLFKGWSIIAILLCTFISQNADAKTIIVGKSVTTKTIKSAIELAQNGDTIRVKSGVYKEGALMVTKGIVFIGEGFPIIDGEDKFENMLVEHDDVYISGFVFKNYDSGALAWGIDEAMRFFKLPAKERNRHVTRIMDESAQRFTHRVCANAYMDMYERMLHRPLIM